MIEQINPQLDVFKKKIEQAIIGEYEWFTVWCTENIESDVRAHYEQEISNLRREVKWVRDENAELRKALEDVADYQHRWSESPIREVQKIARQALGKEQPNE